MIENTLSSLEIPHAHPLEYEDGVCELQFPGLRRVVIPKRPREIVAWRRDMILRAESSPRFRQTMLSLLREPCPEACILWFNGFARLFKQQAVGMDGRQVSVKGAATNIPANSWPCQDWAIRELFDHIHDGRDLGVDKSRQMGVTVLITSVFLWWFLYQPGAVFLVMSEKEELVDNPEDPYSVFWKLDFILERLPWWTRRELRRKRLLIANPEIGASILGRSTTADTGRGGALQAALVDEAASIPILNQILTALADATACRIINSTPKGPGAYSDRIEGGVWDVLRMPWWNHPEKGRGRELAQDPATGEVYVTSPFYADRVERAGGDRNIAEIAQELDMKHALAGASFFDQVHVLRQRSRYAREPLLRIQLSIESRLHEDDWIRHMASTASPDPTIAAISDIQTTLGGSLLLWIDLEDGRPPQRMTYVIGADVGQGQQASNSVASVFAVEMGMKVGSWVSAELNPHELARALCLLGIWFGGATGVPLQNLEANGPGTTTIRQMTRLRYPRIMRRKGRGPAGDRERPALGWHSTRETKETLLQAYRAALNSDEFVNPDAAALDEALKYVRYATGGIGPGRLEHESEAARATHGDRPMGDGLAWDAATTVGPKSEPVAHEPPAGSPAADEKILDAMERGERRASKYRRLWAPGR